MSCATQKSLAAGHIVSFQIHPSIIIFVGGDVGIVPYALSASLYKMITSCVILRQELFLMAEVVAVAGEVGQHPADGDRHPDTDFPNGTGE